MAPEKRSTRRNDADATKKRILTSAAELFNTYGFDATGVSHIADRAGVTKGSVYHHFKSKTDILRELYEAHLRNRLEAFETAAASEREPLRKLEALLQEAFRGIDNSSTTFGIFVRERQVLREPEFDLGRELQRDLYGVFEQVIREGQRTGQIRLDLRPRTTVYSLMGMIAWAEFWFDAKRLGADDFIKDTITLTMYGLATPDGHAPPEEAP